MQYSFLLFLQVSDHAGPQFQGPAFAAVPEQQQQPPMPPNHQMQQQQGGQAQAMLQQSYPGDTGKENTAFVCFRIAFIVSILTGTVIYKGVYHARIQGSGAGPSIPLYISVGNGTNQLRFFGEVPAGSSLIDINQDQELIFDFEISMGLDFA